MKLTIVIPAHNEEGVIIKTLSDLKKKLKYPYQLTVVNDMSTDETSQLVLEYRRNNKNVKLLHTDSKVRGFCAALKKGFESVKSGVVIPVMADLCDDPKTINKMYELISKEKYDVVCGSRYTNGGKKVGGPWLQNNLSRFVNLGFYLLGLPTSDVTNAFKMYRIEKLRNVRFNLKSGVEASMEIFLQVYFKNKNLLVCDIPTKWIGRTIGVSKFSVIKRAPKYGQICIWGTNNLIRGRMGLKLLRFYA